MEPAGGELPAVGDGVGPRPGREPQLGREVGLDRRFEREVSEGRVGSRPATGRPMDITVMDVMRVADGRMVEHWGVADRLAVLKQIGAMGQGGR